MIVGMDTNRHRHSSAGQSREAVLVICAVLLVVLFSATGFLTRAFHRKQATLAAEWFAQGNSSLAAGAAREALDDYRRALIFDPQNENYQLHLAQALAQLGQPDEGRAYLLNLLAERPGDGEVNFELARLAAQSGDTAAAIRFYHGAIYGAWDQDPVGAQTRARLELSQFLVRHQEDTLAEAELISLAANVPEHDDQMHAKVGDLFQSAGDLNRAHAEYRKALTWAPDNLTAWIGAGMVSFKLGDYAEAVADLDRASRADRENQAVAATLETAGLVIAWDPFSERLSPGERAQRVGRALAQAIHRAEECSAAEPGQIASGLEALATQAKSQQRSIWSERSMTVHSDQVGPAMELVFKIEDAAKQTCGEPAGADAALLLIERKYRAPREGISE